VLPSGQRGRNPWPVTHGLARIVKGC
jgi:hypothetical protein